MTLAEQIHALRYWRAILVADIAEEKVRAGEIDAPYWFLDAWQDARAFIAQLRERTR